MDNEERTPAMYLGEKEKKSEFLWLNKRDCNYNFKSKNNESPLSHIMSSMYLFENYSKSGTFVQYIKMIISLAHFGCDFNYPIDEDKNTAIIVFMIVRDFYSLLYVLKYSSNYDLFIKNKYGENASSLFFKCVNSKIIFDIMSKHPTFNYEFIDPFTKNTPTYALFYY